METPTKTYTYQLIFKHQLIILSGEQLPFKTDTYLQRKTDLRKTQTEVTVISHFLKKITTQQKKDDHLG